MSVSVTNNALLAQEANITSGEWPFTCSGTDRILLVGIAARDLAVEKVSYGGVAATRVTALPVSGTTGGVELWELVNPASGSNQVAVTFAGATATAVIGAVCLEGAASVGAIFTKTGSSTTPAVTAASSVGNRVVNVMVATNIALAAKTNGEAHQDYLGEITGGARPVTGGGSDHGGAASVESKWTLNSSRIWAIIAVDVVAAAPTSRSRRRMLV